jgi:hypothetical protein
VKLNRLHWRIRDDLIEIGKSFNSSSLDSRRERVKEDLGETMQDASALLSAIRDRQAYLDALAWKDFVMLNRQKMDAGSIQIWVWVIRVPVVDGEYAFDHGYTVDYLDEPGMHGCRSYRGADRLEAIRFAQEVARARDLDLYFKGFGNQQIKRPTDPLYWGLSS